MIGHQSKLLPIHQPGGFLWLLWTVLLDIYRKQKRIGDEKENEQRHLRRTKTAEDGHFLLMWDRLRS
jgi:hypothetical protein